MASRSGSGSGKRPRYIGLDAPNPSGEDPWDPRSVLAALYRSSGSSGSKKPKKAQNPNRPGKECADAAREIVLHYYKRAVNANATAGVLGCWRRWVSKPVR